MYGIGIKTETMKQNKPTYVFNLFMRKELGIYNEGRTVSSTYDAGKTG